MRNGAETLLPQGVIRPDFAARSESSPIRQVIYAGTSPKKGALLDMLTRPLGITVIRKDAGKEHNDSPTPTITTRKIDVVLPTIVDKKKGPPNPQAPVLVVAADVLTYSPKLRSDGFIEQVPRGKPGEIFDIRQVFQDMRDAARTSGDIRNYSYNIDAASEARITKGEEVEVTRGRNLAHVALDQELVDYFATEEGISEYLKVLKAFLKGPYYISEEGPKHPGSPAGVAGGLELAVLGYFGAVHKVDRISRKDPDIYMKNFRNIVVTAYFGFHEDVLTLVNPNAIQMIEDWTYVDNITNFAGMAA
jgi:hypothetical protein